MRCAVCGFDTPPTWEQKKAAEKLQLLRDKQAELEEQLRVNLLEQMQLEARIEKGNGNG